MSVQYLKKEVRDEVDFLHADKYQSSLVDFNTLGTKVGYKVILSIDKHDEAFSNYSKWQLCKSLQYFKKVRNWVYFLHADKCF